MEACSHEGIGAARIQVIRSLGPSDPLRREWDDLVNGGGSYVPFLCFDWFRIWMDHFGRGREPFVLLLYEGDRLCGIAPFLRDTGSFRGIPKVRQINFMANVHSPVCSFILRDGPDEDRRRYLRIFMGFLGEKETGWDVAELDQLPDEDGTPRLLCEVAGSLGWKHRVFTSYADSYVDGIDCSGEEYVNRLPKKMRSELKRRRKRLSEMGRLRIEIGTDPSEFDRHMEVYHRVRARSWKSPEADGEFLRDARRMAAERGWLRCGFLFLDERPIAAQIRIVANRVAYFMEAVHDEDFGKFAPGHILRSELIRHFIDAEGVTEIDQGRGDESYKRYWGPSGGVRERKGVTIFNGTARGRMLAFVMTRVVPALEKHSSLASAKRTFSRFVRRRG